MVNEKLNEIMPIIVPNPANGTPLVSQKIEKIIVISIEIKLKNRYLNADKF